jgi:hypothetical protein
MTPGPWSVMRRSDGTFCVFRDEGDDYQARARTVVPVVGDEEDARRIAAVPELLEACRTVDDALTAWEDLNGSLSAGNAKARDAVRAAIAKATGEGR